MSPEQQIEAIALGVMNEAGPDIVTDLQQRLGTAYPPASIKGESPHKRSGDLQGSVNYLVEVAGAIITLTIAAGGPEAPYAVFLEPPAALDRPFMAPTLSEWAPILVQRLQDAFGGTSPVISPAGAIMPTQYIAA